MKHFALFISILLSISQAFSQQRWEDEFPSKEELAYRNLLKNKKVKTILTYYHYKKGAPAIADKAYLLDRNGNVITVIKKAGQENKTDITTESNTYDKNGNLLSHIEFNGSLNDTNKYVLYIYDSLNNLTLEVGKESDYKQVGDKLERFYKTRTYTYTNTYAGGLLAGQDKLVNGNLVIRSQFEHDAKGNLTEIKRYLKDLKCLESWVKFTYNPDGSLKDKYYPSHSCGEGNHSKTTMNNNRYIYSYDASKKFVTLEHTNTEEPRGKIFYTYNPAGLLTYISPDDDFGYYDSSIKYEFYK